MTTITKVARVLDLYTPSTPTWGVSEVAAALGMPRSTAHSLLSGLTKIGLLQQPRRGRYTLGWRAFELGQMQRVTSGGLIETAHPIMLEAGRRHAESVALAVYERQSLIFIDKVVGEDPLSVVGPRIGLRYDTPHSFASGRLLMSQRPKKEIDEYIVGGEMRIRSSGRILSPDSLRVQLQRINAAGLSIDYGEAIADVGCVAAPIVGPPGRVIASISVSAPMGRFREKESTLSTSVKAAAATISQRLREAERG